MPRMSYKNSAQTLLDDAALLDPLADNRGRDREEQDMIKMMREGSITPTTFLERECDGLNKWCYVEQYNVGGNEVVRFGLNPLATKDFGRGEENWIKHQISQEGIQLSEARGTATPPTSSGGPRAPSLGSASKASGKYEKTDADNIKPCSLEVLLLQDAVDYLNAPETTAKAVLFDILARENGGPENGRVKPDAKWALEIHTVVLYRNNPAHVSSVPSSSTAAMSSDIFVIDPSNFWFSSHLSNYHVNSSTIHTVHDSKQIYKSAKDNTGPGPTQYRDCVDGAAKIACGLNQAAWQSFSDMNDIKKCDVIQHISNTNVDEYIIEKDLNIRIKQRSDIRVVEAFNTIEKTIKGVHDKAQVLLPPAKYSELKMPCVQILKATYNNDKTVVKSLTAYHLECITKMAIYVGEVNKLC